MEAKPARSTGLIRAGRIDESAQPGRGGRNGHKYSQTVNTKRDGACLGLQGPG